MADQHELPREIISHVLSFIHDKSALLTAGLISKSWLIPALERMWSNMTCLSDEWDEITKLFSRPRLLHMEYRSLVTTLSIHASSHGWYTGELKMNHFRKFLQPCRNLHSLHLGVPALNDDDIWILVTACPNLSSVLLTSGLSSTTKITDEGVVALSQKCKQLQKFHFCSLSVSSLTDRGFDALSEHTKGKLIGFGLELSSFAAASESALPDLPVQKRFSDALLRLVQSNPNLEELCLDWPIGTVEAIVTASTTLKGLKSLKLGNVYSVEPIADLISANISSLLKVSILDTNFQSTPVKTLFTPLSQLPSRLSELKLQGIGFLSDLVPIASMFTHLTVLKLTQSSRAASVINFSTEDHLSDLFKASRHLITVHIPIVTDTPLIALGNSCPLVEDVDVIDGRYITNKGVTLFSVAVQHLKKLALGSARDVNDTAVEVLARNCVSLRHLTLPFGATSISAKGIDALSTQCRGLQALANIPYTVPIEDLVRGLTRLERLLLISICCAGAGGPLLGRNAFSRMDQERIKSSCKRLKHIIING